MFNATRAALLQSGHRSKDWRPYLSQVGALLTGSEWGGYWHCGLPGGSFNAQGSPAQVGEVVDRLPNLWAGGLLGEFYFDPTVINLTDPLNTTVLSRDLAYHGRRWPQSPVLSTPLPSGMDLAQLNNPNLGDLMNPFNLVGFEQIGLNTNTALTIAAVVSAGPLLKTGVTGITLPTWAKEAALRVMIQTQTHGVKSTFVDGLKKPNLFGDSVDPATITTGVMGVLGSVCFVCQQLLILPYHASSTDVMKITSVMQQSVEVPFV